MARNKMYQCPYDKAIQCSMEDPCLGCPEFAPEAMVLAPSASTNTPMQAEKLAKIAAYLQTMEECVDVHNGLISRKAVCEDLRQLLHG